MKQRLKLRLQARKVMRQKASAKESPPAQGLLAKIVKVVQNQTTNRDRTAGNSSALPTTLHSTGNMSATNEKMRQSAIFIR
jgi:hypothetical protein